MAAYGRFHLHHGLGQSKHHKKIHYKEYASSSTIGQIRKLPYVAETDGRAGGYH